MADNIEVNPGDAAGHVSVKTDVVDDVHVPVYKQGFGADGELTLVDTDNPIPMESLGLEGRTRDLLEINEEILNQLKIMNAHFSEWDGDEK